MANGLGSIWLAVPTLVDRSLRSFLVKLWFRFFGLLQMCRQKVLFCLMRLCGINVQEQEISDRGYKPLRAALDDADLTSVDSTLHAFAKEVFDFVEGRRESIDKKIDALLKLTSLLLPLSIALIGWGVTQLPLIFSFLL